MKTHSIAVRITNLIIFTSIIFSAMVSRSQQTITFKDGTELKVFITSVSEDTVRYYLESRPEFVYVETMDHIRTIVPPPYRSNEITDSLPYSVCKKRYSHYLHMTIGGSIMFVSGSALAGLGFAGLVSLSNSPEHDYNSGVKAICTVVAVIGSAAAIGGIIMMASGASNMQKYKEKLHGFSFDLKYTPKETGISLVYRF
jgi:hypothetical protein